MTRHADHRRARVRRVTAKRAIASPPPVRVVVRYSGRAGTLDELADLLLDLLDVQTHSRRT